MTNGNFAFYLSWPFAFNDPNLDLQILDGTTPIGTGGSTSFYGYDRENVQGTVSGLATGQTKALTVKVTKVNAGSATSFTIDQSITGTSSTYQANPTVGFELRNATTHATVASSTSTGNLGRSLSGSVTSGTAYQLWASSTDSVSVSEWQQVPDSAYAPVQLEILGPGTNLSTTSSSGSVSLPANMLTTGGTYTVRVTNKSTASSVHPATPTVSWSTTTRGSDVQNGSLARSQTTSDYSFTSASAAGTLSAGLTWSKDPGESSFASVTMTLKNASGTTLTSATSSSGSLAFTWPLAASTLYKVAITNNSSTQAVRTFTRTLTKPSQGAVKLELKDANGVVVATGQRTKPVTINVGLAPGNYTAVTTPVSGAGTATLSGSYSARPATIVTTFDANDHATRVDDGTTKVTETLAPSGRVLRRVVAPSAGGASTEDTLFFYDDDGDSPSYSLPTAGGALTTYLGGAIDVGGTITYQHSNAHGDVIGTSNSAGGFTERPAADEYGLDTTAPSDRLGWLGKQQRFTIGVANLTRMGVRLYDPETGRFTSVDPVEGGSANDYDYVSADPVNHLDLDGTKCGWRHPGDCAKSLVAKGAGSLAKFGAGIAAGSRYVAAKGHPDGWLREATGHFTSRLSASLAASIASGVGQFVSDSLGRGYGLRKRLVRAAIAGTFAAGAVALTGAACSTGVGCVLLGYGISYAANRAGSRLSRATGYGSL